MAARDLFGGREVVAAMQDQLKAAGRQPFGDGAADAAARTGDENAAIGQDAFGHREPRITASTSFGRYALTSPRASMRSPS